MFQILIDGSIGESHDAGVRQGLQLRRKIAGFDDYDFEVLGCQAKRRKVNDVVKGTAFCGEYHFNAVTDFNYRGALRLRQEDHFGLHLDGSAAERVKRGAYGELWNDCAQTRAIAFVCGGTVGNAGEHNVTGLLFEQFSENFSAVTSAAAGRVIAGIGEDRGVGWRFPGPTHALGDGARLGAELKFFASVPIIVRQFQRDLFLRVGRGSSDDGAGAGAWFISPYVTN